MLTRTWIVHACHSAWRAQGDASLESRTSVVSGCPSALGLIDMKLPRRLHSHSTPSPLQYPHQSLRDRSGRDPLRALRTERCHDRNGAAAAHPLPRDRWRACPSLRPSLSVSVLGQRAPPPRPASGRLGCFGHCPCQACAEASAGQSPALLTSCLRFPAGGRWRRVLLPPSTR